MGFVPGRGRLSLSYVKVTNIFPSYVTRAINLAPFFMPIYAHLTFLPPFVRALATQDLFCTLCSQTQDIIFLYRAICARFSGDGIVLTSES